MLSVEKYNRIPYSKQFRAYSCGQNSFRMIMGFYGTRLERNDIFIRTGFQGTGISTYTEIIKQDYKNFACNEIKEYNLDNLKQELNNNHIILISTSAARLPYLDYTSSSGHFIVLVGYNEEYFFVRDPNSQYVEKLTHIQLEKAWKKPGAVAIYRDDDYFVPYQEIKDFDKSYGYDAVKQKKSGIPISLFIPTIFVTYNVTKPDHLAWKKAFGNYDWSLRLLKGIMIGDIQAEYAPGLLMHRPLTGYSAGLSIIPFKLKMTLAPLLAHSYGSLRELTTKHNNIMDFSSIKRAPYFNYPTPVIDVGYLGTVFPWQPFPETAFAHLITANNLHSVNSGIRVGLGQTAGNISVNGSYTMADFEYDGMNYKQETFYGGDVRLSFLKGGIHKSFNTKNTDLYGHYLGLELNGIPMRISCISQVIYAIQFFRFLGLSKLSFEYIYDQFQIAGQGLYFSDRQYKAGFPVNLQFATFLYGFAYDEIREKRPGREIKYIKRSAQAKLLLNSWMPYFQLSFHYNFTYTYQYQPRYINDHNFGVSIYAGLF